MTNQYIAWLNGTSVARGPMDQVERAAVAIFETDRWQETHINKPTELRITKGARQTVVSTRILSHVATNHGQAPQFETTNQMTEETNVINPFSPNITIDTEAKEVACFVMEFVSNGQFDAWYEAHNEELEGFVGVSNYLANASRIFARGVHSYTKNCSEDEANNFDWMQSLEDFVAQLILRGVIPDGVIEDLADYVLANPDVMEDSLG